MKTARQIAFEIPNTFQSLSREFQAGSISLQQVAAQLMAAGFRNFIDLEFAAQVVKPENV
jgi:hypothetical protein